MLPRVFLHIKNLLPVILLAVGLSGSAQPGYQPSDSITDFAVPLILNTSQESASFKDLKSELTIIDFFGTWCAPCVRALPRLDSIQKQYAPAVKIILVSVEKENQLKKFINGRTNFSLPVIVDENQRISNLFMPPSYPYTVVVGRDNKVLAITEASELTDESLQKWLSGQVTGNKTDGVMGDKGNNATTMDSTQNNAVVKLSEAFIYAAKTGNETTSITAALQNLSFDSLQSSLKSDDEKKAFWINIYNGFTQLILAKDPGKYKNRGAFFRAKQVTVAGKKFSLDQVEHDFLRRSKIKWSLGYLGKLFPGKTARALRVHELDYRIHFALNCGAKSCPPIAFYDAANLSSQLDLATQAYLKSEASYNAGTNELKLPAIMGWFRHDFKGKKHMLDIAKKYGIVPAGSTPRISFKKYNWDIYLNNYKN